MTSKGLRTFCWPAFELHFEGLFKCFQTFNVPYQFDAPTLGELVAVLIALCTEDQCDEMRPLAFQILHQWRSSVLSNLVKIVNFKKYGLQQSLTNANQRKQTDLRQNGLFDAVLKEVLADVSWFVCSFFVLGWWGNEVLAVPAWVPCNKN